LADGVPLNAHFKLLAAHKAKTADNPPQYPNGDTAVSQRLRICFFAITSYCK
jgi:hypothetical protein